MSREDSIKDGLYQHTLNGDGEEVLALTQEGLDLGMNPLDILFDALIPSLQEVGRLFEIGDYFVPEMLVSARAMQGSMGILRPLLAEKGAEPIGKVLMLTVKGDVHDIGKNLYNIMLEGEGFEIFDLGVNVNQEQIVDAVTEHKPQLVGFSAFLTTTMPMFKPNLSALADVGLRDKVRVMVGGAPVTQEYADHVGADGYAPDANQTVRLAKRFMVEMGYDISMGKETTGKAALAAAVQTIEETMSKAGPHDEGMEEAAPD